MTSAGRPVGQPDPQRLGGRPPERRAALLVALAEHPHHPISGIDVVDVQAAQLADPDSGGVQQFDDQPVPQRQRITLLGPGFRCGHGRQGLILAQHRGQGAVGLRNLQPGSGIAGQHAAPGGPRGEGLDRRGAARQRRARGAGAGGTWPATTAAPAGSASPGRTRGRPESRTATAGRPGRRDGCGPNDRIAARGTRRTPRGSPLPYPALPHARRRGAVFQMTRRNVSGVRSLSVG